MYKVGKLSKFTQKCLENEWHSQTRAYVRRMNGERRHRNIWEFCPPGAKGKGKPGNSGMQEVTEKRKKGINSMEWNDI